MFIFLYVYAIRFYNRKTEINYYSTIYLASAIFKQWYVFYPKYKN